MGKLLYQIFITARPRQWLKNLAIFAALIFSGDLLVTEAFSKTIWAFCIFSILTSAIYILNDIVDYEKDRLHPFKRKRPIASGQLSISIAVFAFIAAASGGLYLSIQLSVFLFIICLAYLILQIAYSFFLKSFVILDVLSIASGFILRVVAGAFIIGTHLSGWFYLCVISISLFLAVGKRRSEMTILADKAGAHRKTLSLYSSPLLDGYLSMFGASVFLSWALFTFFAPPPAIVHAFSILNHLPLTLAGIDKWLMITIPVVIYGIMRYEKIIYEGSKAESPERVLLSDEPLLASVIIWGVLVIGILYGGGG